MNFANKLLPLAMALAMALAPGLPGARMAAAAPAAAAQGNRNLPCNRDYVGVADDSGNIIRMQSGQIYDVFPGQNRKVIFWLPLDRVNVCALGGAAVRITNLDPRKGGSVEAVRQY